MKNFIPIILILFFPLILKSQATIDTAVNFNVKAIDGTTINLFHILDEENKIVVIDFFSVTCGPCQEYAPDFQGSYEDFGKNAGNVFHMGINWGADNEQVAAFDEMFGITYPTISGLQGGGNNVYNSFGILSYPTVVIIDPETHELLRKEINPPYRDSINNAIINAGGVYVGNREIFGDILKTPEIFPNPAKSSFSIKTNFFNDSDINVNIYDLTGNLIFSKTFTINNGLTDINVNTNFVKKGFYLVKISNKNKSYTKKLIINN